MMGSIQKALRYVCLGVKFKGHKMKQTPLTNMEGRWVHSTKDAFDALVEMGYKIHPEINSFDDLHDELIIKKQYIDSFILEGGAERNGFKQAYYHKGHFYDEPYEEFTITEEKVPFPELEDIEIFTGPEWWIDTLKLINYSSYDSRLNSYESSKKAYENGVPVTWNLKEKINRKLHENIPLALAIGRLMVETAIVIKCDYGYLNAVAVFKNGKTSFIFSTNGTLDRTEICTLPDDYIIPDQVLQWMKEYQEQGIK